MTVDGGEYYVNTITDAVSWDTPPELLSADESAVDNSDCIWLPMEDGGWEPAHVLKRADVGKKGDKSVTAKPVSGGGKERTIATKATKGATVVDAIYPLKLSHTSPRFMRGGDLVLLESLDPPLVAYCLRHRFEQDLIYTWVGADQSVLVSLNPFKRLPIYGAEALADNSAPSPNRVREPHTYAIASSAYRRMRDLRTDASILISGESGAGKTEATKQCLAFLADVAGSSSGVEQRILRANPVLEAFGNAKTLRNDNSSRFGRWMEVHFHKAGMHEGSISGAFIENYLLEKSRLVSQQPNERSYHIFYQLCASAEWAPPLSLSGGAEGFRYLAQSGCTTVPTIDDQHDFGEVVEALVDMGFEQDDVQWVFSLCAAALHLGNVTFDGIDGDEGSAVDANSTGYVALAATHLGVDAAALTAGLTERQIVIRGETQHLRNKPAQAAEAAEALAKAACTCPRLCCVPAPVLCARACAACPRLCCVSAPILRASAYTRASTLRQVIPHPPRARARSARRSGSPRVPAPCPLDPRGPWRVRL